MPSNVNAGLTPVEQRVTGKMVIEVLVCSDVLKNVCQV